MTSLLFALNWSGEVRRGGFRKADCVFVFVCGVEWWQTGGFSF